MAALFDVSKMITLFQRLCQFAEEFTEEYREPLVEALTALFREGLEEGEEPPNVRTMVSSLVRRLRHTLEKLIDSEAELIVAVKDNTDFSNRRQELTQELREGLEHARTECRNHFGRAKADSAAFPARIAVNSSAVLRQAKVVSLRMRKPGFGLGEPVISNSATTIESILEMYEPKVDDLRTGLSDAVRRRTRIEGRQVAKNKEMRDFRSAYSLFVSMVRSSFRLAGQDELAKRLTLTQPNRRSTSGTPPDDPSSNDVPAQVSPPQTTDQDEAEEGPDPPA